MGKEYKDIQRRHSRYLRGLRSKPTREEVIVKEWLEHIGIYHIFQKGFLKPFHRICDFYFPKRKLILEIDGGYHKETAVKDKQKDTVWGGKGFKTLRVTNEQVLSGEFKDIILNFLK